MSPTGFARRSNEMRVATSSLHGKRVTSIIIGGTERRRFEILGEDRTLRSRFDDQPTCAVIPDAALFQQLVSQWHRERGATSSITQMAMCPSYQQIVGMGDKAIPLILRQIENEGDDPDHWFWALQAITRANPVSEDSRGDMREMARAWLDWAYMAGYDW
jgi:hypothetical protein